MSILRPELVRRVVMSGIGYLPIERRQEVHQNLPRDKKWAEDGTDIVRLWHRTVIKRADFMPMERAIELFLEKVRSLEKYWYAYDGVWQYEIEERFALLKHPMLILQANGYLLEHSRKVKKELLPNAKMIEMLDIAEPVLDSNPKKFTKQLQGWLDQPL